MQKFLKLLKIFAIAIILGGFVAYILTLFLIKYTFLNHQRVNHPLM